MAPNARNGEQSPYIGKVITAFEGAITTRVIAHPHRAFAFEVTFELQHPRLVAIASQKPPMHFHPYQEEYVQVVEGRLGVDIDGRELLLGPDDGEFCIRPWANHRLCPPPPEGGHAERFPTTRFVLSGQETEEAYRLDTVFFENWYAYQDRVVIGGQKVDLLQVMSMFDAGGSYLSFPWWVPLGRSISRGLGIVMGRWMGAMLGYQPFYRAWTTDWQLACAKMETSSFQKRFSDRRKTE